MSLSSLITYKGRDSRNSYDLGSLNEDEGTVETVTMTRQDKYNKLISNAGGEKTMVGL